MHIDVQTAFMSFLSGALKTDFIYFSAIFVIFALRQFPFSFIWGGVFS